ncbi:hypothetical protein HID58_066334, partial [Brassica napus]
THKIILENPPNPAIIIRHYRKTTIESIIVMMSGRTTENLQNNKEYQETFIRSRKDDAQGHYWDNRTVRDLYAEAR